MTESIHAGSDDDVNFIKMFKVLMPILNMLKLVAGQAHYRQVEYALAEYPEIHSILGDMKVDSIRTMAGAILAGVGPSLPLICETAAKPTLIWEPSMSEEMKKRVKTAIEQGVARGLHVYDLGHDILDKVEDVFRTIKRKAKNLENPIVGGVTKKPEEVRVQKRIKETLAKMYSAGTSLTPAEADLFVHHLIQKMYNNLTNSSTLEHSTLENLLKLIIDCALGAGTIVDEDVDVDDSLKKYIPYLCYIVLWAVARDTKEATQSAIDTAAAKADYDYVNTLITALSSTEDAPGTDGPTVIYSDEIKTKLTGYIAALGGTAGTKPISVVNTQITPTPSPTTTTRSTEELIKDINDIKNMLSNMSGDLNSNGTLNSLLEKLTTQMKGLDAKKNPSGSWSVPSEKVLGSSSTSNIGSSPQSQPSATQSTKVRQPILSFALLENAIGNSLDFGTFKAVNGTQVLEPVMNQIRKDWMKLKSNDQGIRRTAFAELGELYEQKHRMMYGGANEFDLRKAAELKLNSSEKFLAFAPITTLLGLVLYYVLIGANVEYFTAIQKESKERHYDKVVITRAQVRELLAQMHAISETAAKTMVRANTNLVRRAKRVLATCDYKWEPNMEELFAFVSSTAPTHTGYMDSVETFVDPVATKKNNLDRYAREVAMHTANQLLINAFIPAAQIDAATVEMLNMLREEYLNIPFLLIRFPALANPNNNANAGLATELGVIANNCAGAARAAGVAPVRAEYLRDINTKIVAAVNAARGNPIAAPPGGGPAFPAVIDAYISAAAITPPNDIVANTAQADQGTLRAAILNVVNALLAEATANHTAATTAYAPAYLAKPNLNIPPKPVGVAVAIDHPKQFHDKI